MNFINFPIVRFSFCLAIGIVVARYLTFEIPLLIWLPPILLFLVAIYFLTRKQLVQNPIFATLTYFAFFLLGFAIYQLQLPDFNKSNFVHFTSGDKQSQLLQLKITETLKPDLYNDKFLAEVISVQGQKQTAKSYSILKKIPSKKITLQMISY